MLLKRLFIKIRISVAIVILFFVAIFYFPFPAVGKTILLASEVIPQFPVKPMKFLTRAPIVETVKIKTSKGEIAADLYRPRDKRKHPAAIFTLGIAIDKDNLEVRRISEALARLGFVVLTPDLPDFMSGMVWTDSVDSLISSVQYLDKQDFVDKQKIGFAGFCVGSSVSMVAAEDPKIADKVSFIAAIAPYYDLITLSQYVVTKQIISANGTSTFWNPNSLSVETVRKGFINFVIDEKERQMLLDHFFKNKEISQGDLVGLDRETRIIYDYLGNTDPSRAGGIMESSSKESKELLKYLSPGEKIGNLKAKVFILNDSHDTFVPKVETQKFTLALPKGQISYKEIDSFEHVNPKNKLPRWAAAKQFYNLSVFLYKFLSEVI